MTRATRYACRSNRYCEKDMRYFELSSLHLHLFFFFSPRLYAIEILEVTGYLYGRNRNGTFYSFLENSLVLEDSLAPISSLCSLFFILLAK